MYQGISDKLEAVRALCRQYRVARLFVFGSAAGDAFRQQHSDLDFLVTFSPMTPHEHREAYFGLLDALQALFHTPIDLVEEPAIRNPYFREELEETRVMLYAA